MRNAGYANMVISNNECRERTEKGVKGPPRREAYNVKAENLNHCMVFISTDVRNI